MDAMLLDVSMVLFTASESVCLLIVSEKENAVLSPHTALTPNPWSIEKEPAFTIPSSKLQDSAILDCI